MRAERLDRQRRPIVVAAISTKTTKASSLYCAGQCLGAILPALMLVSCTSGERQGPPPRLAGGLAMPVETSSVAVPIEADLKALGDRLDATLPRTLWTIDERVDRCIPPQKVNLLGANLKVIPAIACSLSGEVTRGPLSLRGSGDELIAEVPINARITARDAARLLKGKTATGAALVEAHIKLDVSRDWRPKAVVRLHYDWTDPPGIDLLGKRILFTEKADEKLQPVVRKLEGSLPLELSRIDLRHKADQAWRAAFTSISLNDASPPVWMRITPRRIEIGGYEIENGRLRLNAGIEAQTETFVGARPADPPPAALPILEKSLPERGLRFFIPVQADYAQLEPIVLRALTKRSQRPFDLPGIGPVVARVDRVTAYGTDGGKIAVGIDLQAAPASTPRDVTRGRIWLVARPVNAPGSARVDFADITVQGATNRASGNILLALVNSPGVSTRVAAALGQNLDHDLAGLLIKVRRAIASRQVGDFTIRAHVANVQTGVVQAAGDGLHLPVRANGDAEITYVPRSRTR